jgi:hypothetical protein
MTIASQSEGAEGLEALNRAELVISAELQLAYDPLAGRLWRLDAGGAIAAN